MKSCATVTASIIFALAALAGTAQGQSILQGPVVNPANGNTYYRLSASTWTAAQEAARALGGNLVTIDDAAENAFVQTTFNAPGRQLWLGYHDPNGNNTFRWVSNQESSFTLWRAGEPNNFGTERFVEMRNFDGGQWNNTTDAAFGANQGIVEVERFSLEWSTIDGGARTAAEGGFELWGSTGQPDAAAAVSAGRFELVGGYWPAAVPVLGPQPCTQDYNGIDGVNGDDLADYIADFFDSTGVIGGFGQPIAVPGGFGGLATGAFTGFGRPCGTAPNVPQPNPWGAPVGAYRDGGYKVTVGQNNSPCTPPNGDDLADYIVIFFNGCD
jgi:hypothetical protein